MLLPGSELGPNTHLRTQHPHPPYVHSHVGPSLATGTATEQTPNLHSAARPSRCAQCLAQSVPHPGHCVPCHSPVAYRPRGHLGGPSHHHTRCPTHPRAAPPRALHSGQVQQPVALQGSLQKCSVRPERAAAWPVGMSEVSHTHPSTRRPHPARTPRAAAGKWICCTGSGASQSRHSAPHSVPLHWPCSWAQVRHRLAQASHIAAAGTPQLRPSGPTWHPALGPMSRPQTPPRGHRSGSVRPLTAERGPDLSRSRRSALGGSRRAHCAYLFQPTRQTHLSTPQRQRFLGHRRVSPGW